MKSFALAFFLGLVLPTFVHSADDFHAGTIKYYDHLKKCTPYTFSYPHPLMKGFTGQNIIRGKKGDKCQVTLVLPGDTKLECEYSAKTIQFMTSEAKYKDALEGRMSGSSSDPGSDECKL